MNGIFSVQNPAVVHYRKKAQISIRCRDLLAKFVLLIWKWLSWRTVSHEPSSIKWCWNLNSSLTQSGLQSSRSPLHRSSSVLFTVCLFSLIWGVHWFTEQTKAALFYSHMCQISPWHRRIFIGKQQHKSQCSCIRTLLKKQLPTVSFWGGKIPFMCVRYILHKERVQYFTLWFWQF